MNRLLALLVLALAPLPARAFTIGLDIYEAFEENGYDGTGPGANLRVGGDLGVPGAHLQLEVGGSYVGFTRDTLWAGFGGARLGAGDLFQPGVFAHLGYGNLDAPAEKTPNGRPAVNAGGVFGRAGVYFDLSLPIVSVGVDAAYNAFLTGDFQLAGRPTWLTAGIHAAVSL